MTWTMLALSILLSLSQAQDDVEGRVQEPVSQSEVMRGMKESIKNDPAVADSLAERIMRSTLSDRISGAADPGQKLKEVREWVTANPDSAAQLAVGLANDDREGSHRFEAAISRNADTRLNTNKDNMGKSIYGRLKKNSIESKLQSADDKMTEEERREILKTMFEGQGGQTSQIITQEEDGKAPPDKGATATGISTSYYDRLSQYNMRGYSPQLMAIQNALNARRVPGAPKLIETGKLDYETLSYPAWGMRYDIRNLETRMRHQMNYELAKLLGLERNYTPEQLLDPQIEAMLKSKAASAKLNPRFERRLRALERAAAALRDFDAAAGAAKDPRLITRELLIALGSKQKEAARWITVASLEEEIQRLEEDEGFMSPDLKALIEACPVSEGTRAAYKRRGEGYKTALLRMKTNAEESIKKLEADDWQATISSVESAIEENAGLRKNLSRNIKDFVNTPYRLRSLYEAQPRWRELLEKAVKRYLPSSSYGRKLRQRDGQRDVLKDVFGKIASGDLDAAHTILVSLAPSGGPRSQR